MIEAESLNFCGKNQRCFMTEVSVALSRSFPVVSENSFVVATLFVAVMYITAPCPPRNESRLSRNPRL